MYRLLKTRHLVQLLTAFYSYMFTSNLKQFLRDQPGLDGTYRARGRPGRGHFLCVRYKWVTQKNLSPSQLLSSSFRGKNSGIYKQVRFAGRVHPEGSLPSLESRAMVA